MDLKKLFVYVPADSEATFISSVINVPTEAAKYSNKIVFLEDSNRIWVKNVFYGCDLETLTKKFQSIWATIGLTAKEDGTSALSKTVGETVYTDLVAWIEALDTKVRTDFAAADSGIISSYQDADAALKLGYETADAALKLGYETADSGIISSYQAADQALNAAYTAFKNKVGAIDGLTGTLKEYIDDQDASARTEVAVSGSGLSVQKTPGADGHDIYTVIADQSIWEFMGSATAASVAAIPATLDGKYAEEGAKRDHAEVGDVWAVTVGSNTTLYACSKLKSGSEEYNTWTLIGSAQGISGVDTTPSHGVNLTNTASVVGVTVTPGAVADGDTSVITGGAVFTAIANEHAAAYAKAEAEADEAQANAYAKIDADIATEHAAAYAEAAAKADEAQDNAYAYANSRANEAQANAYAEAAAQADEAQANAYAKIDAEIDALDASYTGSQTYSDNAYVTYTFTEENGVLTAATITVDPTVIENFVVDSLWETYSAS